jgi:hypothetical protein
MATCLATALCRRWRRSATCAMRLATSHATVQRLLRLRGHAASTVGRWGTFRASARRRPSPPPAAIAAAIIPAAIVRRAFSGRPRSHAAYGQSLESVGVLAACLRMSAWAAPAESARAGRSWSRYSCFIAARCGVAHSIESLAAHVSRLVLGTARRPCSGPSQTVSGVGWLALQKARAC